jgi:hypothetical protein
MPRDGRPKALALAFRGGLARVHNIFEIGKALPSGFDEFGAGSGNVGGRNANFGM